MSFTPVVCSKYIYYHQSHTRHTCLLLLISLPISVSECPVSGCHFTSASIAFCIQIYFNRAICRSIHPIRYLSLFHFLVWSALRNQHKRHSTKLKTLAPKHTHKFLNNFMHFLGGYILISQSVCLSIQLGIYLSSIFLCNQLSEKAQKCHPTKHETLAPKHIHKFLEDFFALSGYILISQSVCLSIQFGIYLSSIFLCDQL